MTASIVVCRCLPFPPLQIELQCYGALNRSHSSLLVILIRLLRGPTCINIRNTQLNEALPWP